MGYSLKQKILAGVFWQGLEHFGSQGLSILVSIVLARLLVPAEFGIIAVVRIFVGLCICFVSGGFNSVLIQKKDMIDADCCSVFFINITVAILMYAVLFWISPWIADFYTMPKLSVYLKVMALIIIIYAFSVVQDAMLKRKMLFHLSFQIGLGSLIISGIVGIVMALLGFGVWALIAQQLTSSLTRCFLLWFLVKWRPQWCFDLGRARQLFRIGGKFMASSLLASLYEDIYSVVISKIANLTELGFYNRGRSIPALGMGVINSTVGSVLFPAFSSLQDDRTKVKELATRGLKNVMFLVIPSLTLLFILAEPLVKIVFTDKWLPCVIYLQLCCILFFYWPFHTTNLQIICAYGRSDVILILEIIKKIQTVLVILLTYRYGVVTMVAAGAAMELIYLFENAWFNWKLIKYPPWKQLGDILPLLLIAIICGVILYFGLLNFIDSPWMKLFAGCGVFSGLYIGIVWISGLFPQDILNLLKRRESVLR